MRQPVVLLARVLAYIDVLALAPWGGVYSPDLVKALVERYSFQKFPKTVEEFDLTKGVEFAEGTTGSGVISRLSIWQTMIVVETRSGSAVGKEMIESMLSWARKKFSLSQVEITKVTYISDVSFYSDIDLLALNPTTKYVGDFLTREVSKIWNEDIVYVPAVLRLGHDPLSRKYALAPFTIERKADEPFSDNKYFSEAPLPTDVHLQLIEEIERAMLP